MLPQVLLTGAERLLRRSLSQGAQGATHLLLHQRVLVGDGVQQDGGQLCNDKAQRARSGAARPASHRLGLPPQDAGPSLPGAFPPPCLPPPSTPGAPPPTPWATGVCLAPTGCPLRGRSGQPQPALTPQALTAPRLLPPLDRGCYKRGRYGLGARCEAAPPGSSPGPSWLPETPPGARCSCVLPAGPPHSLFT